MRSLRSLREENKVRVVVIFIFHAEAAKSAEFFHYIPRWRWSSRELRYDRRAQRQSELKG